MRTAAPSSRRRCTTWCQESPASMNGQPASKHPARCPPRPAVATIATGPRRGNGPSPRGPAPNQFSRPRSALTWEEKARRVIPDPGRAVATAKTAYFDHRSDCQDSAHHLTCAGRWRGVVSLGFVPDGKRSRSTGMRWARCSRSSGGPCCVTWCRRGMGDRHLRQRGPPSCTVAGPGPCGGAGRGPLPAQPRAAAGSIARLREAPAEPLR